MFPCRHLSLSITMAACLLAAAAPAANAAPVTTPVGATVSVLDPAGSARSASVQFTSGTSSLKFSIGADFDGFDEYTLGGAMGVLNVANLKLIPGAATTIVENSMVGSFGGDVRVGAAVNSNLSSAAIDPLTGAVSTLSAGGSWTLSGTRLAGVLTGGSVTLSNVRFDLENKRVVADLNGVKNAIGTAPTTTYSSRDTALWTFDSITGPTALPPSALLAADPSTALRELGYTIVRNVDTVGPIIGYAPGGCSGSYGGYGYGYGYGYGGGGCYNPSPVPIFARELGLEVTGQTRIDGLQITQLGFDFLSKSMGLLAPGKSALYSITDYGSVTLSTNYVLGVPEPSTYALMALGLGLMVGAVRRNKRLAA